MIRVNLMRNRVGDSTVATSVGGGAGGGNEEVREVIVKVACIFIFCLGLMIYENQNIRSLNEERARVQSTVSELETQAQAKSTEVEAIKDIAHQAQELEDKLKVLRLLSKLRLREVKTLDFMQSSIPEKVWLKSVRYEADREGKESVERGHYQFDGSAVTTEDLSEFVKRLEDSAYLNEVIVMKNQESNPGGKSSTLREFQFTADVEVKK